MPKKVKTALNPVSRLMVMPEPEVKVSRAIEIVLSRVKLPDDAVKALQHARALYLTREGTIGGGA